MASRFLTRSRNRGRVEEEAASDREAAASLGMDIDEDDDILFDAPGDLPDEDEQVEEETEEVALQLSDPRVRPSRQKAKAADPEAPDKANACQHCGREYPTKAAMWGHQARCEVRVEVLNLEPHPLDRMKMAAKQQKADTPLASLPRTSSRPRKPTGPVEEFACEDCGKMFPVAMRLYGHMSQCSVRLRRLANQKKEKEAPTTSTEVDEAPILLRLKRPGTPTKATGAFTCPECGKSFVNANALGGHKASHRFDKDVEEPSARAPEWGFQCGVCGLIFANGQALGGHKGSHKPTDVFTEEEKRQNTKRGSLAPSPSPARRRGVENAVEGGWACDVCGLIFTTGQALGGHKGSHKATDCYTDEEKQHNMLRTSLKLDAFDIARRQREASDSQLKKALVALKRTMQISDAEPFNVPVDAEGLGIPDYLDVVKCPMDFGTIRSKLEKNEYLCVEQVLADVRLVSANCRLYNNEVDPIVDMLEVVEKQFKSEWVKAGLPVDQAGNPAAPEVEESEQEGSESDEEGLVEPQQGRRVRFAPGVQSPPLRHRSRESLTEHSADQSEPQEGEPRRGRGRPPSAFREPPSDGDAEPQAAEPRRGRGRPPSRLALRTGVSSHRPNCPCVICKQARKSPRVRYDSSDGEFEGPAKRFRAEGSDDEDGAAAFEDDTPPQYFAKGAHLPPAQLSAATWQLGYQLFAGSTGAKLLAAGDPRISDALRILALSASARQEKRRSVGSRLLMSADGRLGPLMSGMQRVGPQDVRAVTAELLERPQHVGQTCQ